MNYDELTGQFLERSQAGWEVTPAPALCQWTIDTPAGRVIVAAGPNGFTVHPMGNVDSDAVADVARALFPDRPSRTNGRTVEVASEPLPEFLAMLRRWYRDDTRRTERPVFECVRCGHEWMPKQDDDGMYRPSHKCPRCQSRHWQG